MRLRKYVCFISFLFFFSFFSRCLYAGAAYRDETNRYECLVGEIITIDVYKPKRISIVDPAILDVIKVKDTGLDIIGKKQGVTRIDVWTDSGRESFQVAVFMKDLKALKERVSRLLQKRLGISNVEIIPDKLNGKIMLKGKVSKQDKKNIEAVLAGFGGYIEDFLGIISEQRLVKINVNILELSKDFKNNLGFNWQNYLQVREEPYNSSTSDTTGVVTTLDRVATGKIFTINGLSRDALTSKINLLVQRGKGKILSQPQMVCLSGEEAKILVGGEVPIVRTTVNSNGRSTDVDYKEYGVVLKVRPKVEDGGKIKINIYTEVSSIDWANAVVADGISIPAFSKRDASTEVFLKSGQTVFIGGLIKNTQSKNISKLPALGTIPIIGALFRSKDFQNNKTDLVITLTPEIVSAGGDNSAEDLKKYKVKVVESNSGNLASVNLKKYISDIQREILSSLIYPPVAEEDMKQGDMLVSIHLVSDGSVLNVRMVKSSGYKILDDTVISTIKNIGRFPPFPPVIEEKELWINIPIVYKLD